MISIVKRAILYRSRVMISHWIEIFTIKDYGTRWFIYPILSYPGNILDIFSLSHNMLQVNASCQLHRFGHIDTKNNVYSG